MERHDAMTRRPSLLAGGPEPANRTPRRERILPSIDTTPPGRRARRRMRTWLPLAALPVLVAAAAALWLQRPAGPTAEAPVATGALPDPPTGAAIIIEDTAPPTAVAPAPAPAAASPGPAAADGPDAAAGSGPGGSAPASPFAPVAGSDGDRTHNPFTGRRQPAPARVPARSPDPAPSAGDDAPTLLATLLDHIHATAEPEPASGMDRMVERLAREGAAGPQAQAQGAEFRSWQIQLNLRECPPANTAEGVACRKEICEVYAGRDPACPAG